MIFNKRITPSGIRFVKAQVNGVNGVILFPDDWDISLTLFIDHNVLANYYNKGGKNYKTAILNKTSWEQVFEANGAVFLPAAGCRRSYSSSVDAIGKDGIYWSCTYEKNNSAYNVSFDNNSLDPNSSYDVSSNFSVRLVRDVK